MWQLLGGKVVDGMSQYKHWLFCILLPTKQLVSELCVMTYQGHLMSWIVKYK